MKESKMKSKYLLSIVIPVYNVEKYLNKCILSTLSLEEKYTEIILVDDGSTDLSGRICDKYANMHKNIIVVHKKNGGLSSARNTGIDACNGKYIMFLDSDDYLDEKNSMKLLEIIKELDVDLIMSNYYEINQNSKKISEVNNDLQREIIRLNDKTLINIFNKTEGLWPAWKNIIKRDFLKKNNFRFKEGYLHEDIDFTTKVLLDAKTFFYYPTPWYCYRIERNGSITNSKNFKSLNDTIGIVIDLKRYMNQKDLNINLKKVIMDRLSKSVYSKLELIDYGNIEERKKILNEINTNKYLIKSSTLIKHRFFYYSSKAFGINNTINIYTKLKGYRDD